MMIIINSVFPPPSIIPGLILAHQLTRSYYYHHPPRLNLKDPSSHHPPTLTTMKIVPVPVRQDNYAYLIIDPKSKTAAVVDPYDPNKVIRAAQDENVELSGTILTTHHHHDHSGGNEELIRLMTQADRGSQPTKGSIQVYGGSSKIPGLTTLATHQMNFELDRARTSGSEDDDDQNRSRISVTCLATPCHTRDSISFYVRDLSIPKSPGVVFTGDTLFVAGCGRFFEGTAEEMDRALNQTLGCLPDETITYVGHEYTESNARFARSIEPDNPHLVQLIDDCERSKGRDGGAKVMMTTGKYTIGDEKKFNPFMRLDEPRVRASALGSHRSTTPSRAEIMQSLRDLKNSF